MTDVFPEEIVTEVREEEYVKDYLDSPNLQKIAIDFIKIASQDKGKESEIKYETLEYEKFGNVEEMVKHTFPNLLAEDDSEVGTASQCVHEINLMTGTKPIKQRARRIPINLRDEFKKCIDKMLERGIIRPSKSEWSSPTVLVRKKTGELRVCIDYRMLNIVTVKDSYPLPNVEDFIYRLNKKIYKTTMDAIDGYFLVKLAEKDKHLTAFVTDDGLYEFNVMPFGLTNAPATFQRMMNHVLANEIGHTCLV